MHDMTQFWLVLVIIFAIIESVTAVLVTIWFTFGALIAMIVSIFVPVTWIQVVVFLVSSAILLYFTRPLVKRYVKGKGEKTNADRFVGMEGVVISPIDPTLGEGQVKVSGQIWSAKTKDGSLIEQDARVEVLEIVGVKLIVKKI